jgi:hypothetical protein
MNRVILFLFILLAPACKSSKKNLVESDSTSTSIQNRVQVDSTGSTSKKTESAKEENEILEEVIQSHVVLDSAGTKVIKPTTTTRRKTTITKEVQKTQDTTAIKLVVEETISADSTSQSNSDLQNEFEGQDIAGSIVDAFIPTWFKIISLIVGLIIATLVSKKIIKSIVNQSKQTTEK